MSHQYSDQKYKKIKRHIKTLYLSSNSDVIDNYIFITLEEPINYQKYFGLTRQVHLSIINFQINDYLDQTSNKGVFLSLDPPTLAHSTGFTNILLTYDSLKKIIKKVKADLLKHHNYNQLIYVKKANAEKMINHIDQTVLSDELYKKSSIRQCKSKFNRQIKKIDALPVCDNRIYTADQAIAYYFFNFEECCKISTIIHTNTNLKLEIDCLDAATTTLETLTTSNNAFLPIKNMLFLPDELLT